MDQLGAHAFDFWIGEWNCEFEGGSAINTVTREFQDNVVRERFVMESPQSWQGTSLSVYAARLDLWRQTWVDTDGSYWHFVGGLVEGNPCFATPEPVDFDPLYKRMIFSNITDAGFDWRWESSADQSTWTENWSIRYTRR
jgi:hypothetical protein